MDGSVSSLARRVPKEIPKGLGLRQVSAVLVSLDLSFNPSLSNAEKSSWALLGKLSRLERLWLSFCNLKELSPHLFQESLQELYLNANRLTMLSEDICKLTNLRILSVSALVTDCTPCDHMLEGPGKWNM